MTTSVTYAGLYIGKLGDMDPTEGTGTSGTIPSNSAEAAPATLGGQTFGSANSPLYAQSTRVTLNDANDNGTVSTDQYGLNETVTYRLGDQTYTYKPDMIVVVQNCTITQRLLNGTEQTTTGTLRIMQDANGNAFIMPPRSTDTGEAAITQYPIVSVRFPSASSNYSSNWSGVSTSRQNLTAFRDGYVDGTDGNDSIVAGTYTGDVDGDRVDNSDAILPGATASSNEDFIRAGMGNDTVWAGAGADSVRGGDGISPTCS